MKASTLNKPQGIIATRKVLVGYWPFTSKGKLAHLDIEEYRDINIFRDTGASQSLLTQKCLSRGQNSAMRKQVYIRKIGGKKSKKTIPFTELNCSQKYFPIQWMSKL